MAARLKVYVTVDEKLSATLSSMGKKGKGAARNALRKVSRHIFGTIKSNAPVRSGTLKRSIKKTKAARRRNAMQEELSIGTGILYEGVQNRRVLFTSTGIDYEQEAVNIIDEIWNQITRISTK